MEPRLRSVPGTRQKRRLCTSVFSAGSLRTDLGESSAEPAFLDEFFRQTWGYAQTGQAGGEVTFSLYPEFPVPGAGASGGTGAADAALGHFDEARQPYVPQVLCEFKDIRTDLDARQRRKGSTRSPVRQALDYLSGARRGMFGEESIQPMWALVTNMNEFRLHWHDRGDRQFIRFIIHRTGLFDGAALLDDDEDARFDRFLFSRVFSQVNAGRGWRKRSAAPIPPHSAAAL